MKYQTGKAVPRNGLYRCTDCGEAQEYRAKQEFGKCSCSPEDGEGETWTLIEEY